MISSTTIEIALSERYTAPEWAFLTQVRNGTGYSRMPRTADALAMSLYPSRGLHLHGFEIKVARSDWTRELKNPDKAEEIARFCHFWWIAAPTGVVPIEEVPANWGLLELSDGKFRIAKKAEFHQADPLTFPIIASVFRKASTSMVPVARVQGDVDAAIQRDRETRSDRQASELKHAKEKLEAYKEFERIAGVEVNRWNLGDVGEAVRRLTKHRSSPMRLRRELDDIERVASIITKDIAEARGVLDALNEEAAQEVV